MEYDTAVQLSLPERLELAAASSLVWLRTTHVEGIQNDQMTTSRQEWIHDLELLSEAIPWKSHRNFFMTMKAPDIAMNTKDSTSLAHKMALCVVALQQNKRHVPRPLRNLMRYLRKAIHVFIHDCVLPRFQRALRGVNEDLDPVAFVEPSSVGSLSLSRPMRLEQEAKAYDQKESPEYKADTAAVLDGTGSNITIGDIMEDIMSTNKGLVENTNAFLTEKESRHRIAKDILTYMKRLRILQRQLARMMSGLRWLDEYYFAVNALMPLLNAFVIIRHLPYLQGEVMDLPPTSNTSDGGNNDVGPVPPQDRVRPLDIADLYDSLDIALRMRHDCQGLAEELLWTWANRIPKVTMGTLAFCLRPKTTRLLGWEDPLPHDYARNSLWLKFRAPSTNAASRYPDLQETATQTAPEKRRRMFGGGGGDGSNISKSSTPNPMLMPHQKQEDVPLVSDRLMQWYVKRMKRYSSIKKPWMSEIFL